MAEIINGPKPVGPGSITQDGRGFSGPGGTDVFRARMLVSSLRLWAKTKIIPTKGFGIDKMLKLALEYTGVKYKRSEADRAAEAVSLWADDAYDILAKSEYGGT